MAGFREPAAVRQVWHRLLEAAFSIGGCQIAGKLTHMKQIGIVALWVIMLTGIGGVTQACDPIGSGAGSSLPSTVLFLTSTIRERIDFPEANLEEVISFLQRTGDVPAELGVKLDYSRMPQPVAIRVKLVGKNLSLLQAVSLLAEQSGANLQIEPGRLILLPKQESGKN